jgi:hypothetical protein
MVIAPSGDVGDAHIIEAIPRGWLEDATVTARPADSLIEPPKSLDQGTINTC